uniref:Angiotensin II receptor associated protein n=1 Tax=Lynx canadensis TaxID=61383 RepID=A0A667I6V5_LYNCA
MELPTVNLKTILLVHWLLTTCCWGDFSAKPGLETVEPLCAFCRLQGTLPASMAGLHSVRGPLSLGKLHHPGLGRVGRCSEGLHRRHKPVSGWLGGHHLPGHRPHQHLLPADRLLGHGALWCRHGHPQPAPQALVLLLRLPHVPGARG